MNEEKLRQEILEKVKLYYQYTKNPADQFASG